MPWPYSTEIAFDDEDFTARDHNIIVEVLISAWYAILSNTDLICYLVVFINQVSMTYESLKSNIINMYLTITGG